MPTMPSASVRLRAALGVVAIAAVAGGNLLGQERLSSRAVAVVAGPADYDLSGTGWSWSAGARLDLPVAGPLLVEPGLGVFHYDDQFSDRSWYLLPEVSVQLQYPGRGVRPYVGVGGGWAWAVQGPGNSDLSVHAALGVRIDPKPSWGLRTEARMRNISGFEGNNSILEFVVGYSRGL